MTDKKKLDSAVLLDTKTSNKIVEFLSKLKIKYEEYKSETLLINACKKKIPLYFLVDNTKISNIFLEFIKEKIKGGQKLSIIFFKLETDDDSFKNIYSLEIPNIIFSITSKNVKLTEFQDIITDLDIRLNSNTDIIDEIKEKGNVIQKIGYKYIKRIGSGMEGTVDLVNDLKHNRLAAMKTVVISSLKKHEIELMTQKEKMALDIKCPTIIEFYEIEESQNARITYMEYASGGTLKEYLFTVKNEGIILHPDEILSWITQILLGLKVLHKLKIAHRDIKPDNILLCENPNHKESKNKSKMICKISDLGASKVTNYADKHTVIGTPFYTAPEVINSISYSCEVDLWSLGVMIHEISIGDKPFENLDAEILYKLITTKKIDKFPKNFDERIKFLIINMLHKRPDLRLTLDDIFQLSFIKEEIVKLLEIFPHWSKYDYISELINLKSLKPPLSFNFIPNNEIDFIKTVYILKENVESTYLKKNYFGSTYNTVYKGLDLLNYLKEIYEQDDLIDSISKSLLSKKFAINVSKSIEEEEFFNENDYYCLLDDTLDVNYDNITIRYLNINLDFNNNHNYLSQHILELGISLYNVIIVEEKDISLNDSSLIEFFYGISMFQHINLISDDFNPNSKYAFLLNLYQIMIINSLIKDNFKLKMSKNFMASYFKNNESINYKFKDCYLNDIELMYGILRNNEKPKENYFALFSSDDIRLNIAKNIKFNPIDRLIAIKIANIDSFSPKSYCFKIFFSKNVDYQLYEYASDFFNTCIKIAVGEIFISRLYENYFNDNYKTKKGIFELLNSTLQYNKSQEHDLFKVPVCTEMIQTFTDISLINSKVNSKKIYVIFDL